MRASITAKIMITAAAAVFALSLTAYAGQWKNDSRGWWYQNDDGSYPAATWQWIDSNGDGVAECYYFYSDGYMAYNNEIDNYYVNPNGQWERDGKVQRKNVGQSSAGTVSYGNGAAGRHAMQVTRKEIPSSLRPPFGDLPYNAQYVSSDNAVFFRDLVHVPSDYAYYSIPGTHCILESYYSSSRILTIMSNDPHEFFNYDNTLYLEDVLSLFPGYKPVYTDYRIRKYMPAYLGTVSEVRFEKEKPEGWDTIYIIAYRLDTHAVTAVYQGYEFNGE
jgi:hypothetical protein